MTTEIRDAVVPYLKRSKVASPEELKACCPFHRKSDGSEERDPSFYINVYSGLWYCQSCHARGNLYTFFRDVGIPRAEIQERFQDILDEAGKYAPAPPDPLSPSELALEPLPESFLGYFDYCPQRLLDEGYPKELLRQFDIGFDFKHQRITFPIRDRNGRLIGISGRAQQDGVVPRYKLYDREFTAYGLPERKVSRSSLIWNIHRFITKQNISHEHPSTQPLVIVEGYKAALRVAQAGILDVGALLGSDISLEQQYLLISLGCPILLMLDNNAAGRNGQLKAGLKLIDLYLSTRVYVVHYEGDQPSDLTPQAILDAVQSPQSFLSWYTTNS